MRTEPVHRVLRRPLTRILVKKSLLIICIRQWVDASFLSDSTPRLAPDGQPAPLMRHTETCQMNRYRLPSRTIHTSRMHREPR